MPSVEVAPGVELHCERRGSGPALVLLNGMSQSTANWMTQARKLSEDFEVICYDARGQGRSPVGPSPLTLERHVEDLEALLDGLGLSRVRLCGFSFGARLALGFAARRPGRVAGLVLTSAGAGDSALRRLIVGSWLEVLRRGGVEAMSWCALPHILGERFVAKVEGQIAGMIRASVQRNSAAGLEALLEGYRGFPDPLEDAGRVRARALVISADGDPLVSRAGTEALCRRIEGARQVLIEGCGHTIPIEEPERWAALVRDFFRSGDGDPIGDTTS
jgi:3-oxoadipate enol-lactonase